MTSLALPAPPAALGASPVPLLPRDAALFLDFDGTLVAIASRPEAVQVGAWLAPALERLQVELGGAVALVSGRPLSQLDGFLAPLCLAAAGVHGVEFRTQAGHVTVLSNPPPQPLLQLAERLAAEHPLLQLERKPSAFALHYRAAPALGPLVTGQLATAVEAHPAWVALLGKCVVEIKPARATKGHAVREFLRSPVFAGRMPVFVGDDATDEEGFAAVQAVGGLGIKVGEGPSQALGRLADPEAVQAWLQASLAQWEAVAGHGVGAAA